MAESEAIGVTADFAPVVAAVFACVGGGDAGPALSMDGGAAPAAAAPAADGGGAPAPSAE